MMRKWFSLTSCLSPALTSCSSTLMPGETGVEQFCTIHTSQLLSPPPAILLAIQCSRHLSCCVLYQVSSPQSAQLHSTHWYAWYGVGRVVAWRDQFCSTVTSNRRGGGREEFPFPSLCNVRNKEEEGHLIYLIIILSKSFSPVYYSGEVGVGGEIII